MKSKDELKRFRQMTGHDLVKEINNLEKKIFSEFSKPVGKDKTKQTVPLIKKNIARLKTIINEQKRDTHK